MNVSVSLRAPEADPAMLAFVKCHLTSVLRWELLRALEALDGQATTLKSLADRMNKPTTIVGSVLSELTEEGVVEEDLETDGSLCYRLNPSEPSTRVIGRLISASSHNQELRQLIVARMLQGETSGF